MRLLITIAFHYAPERTSYLLRILANISLCYRYEKISVIIDTDSDEIYKLGFREPLQIYVHKNLEHPFHLTWMHRGHIKNNIDKFDIFYYTEDDMLLPYENYLNYLENFELLWPYAVPSFIRIEEHENEEFVADIHNQILYDHIICVGNVKSFIEIKPLQNYHAFWILPQHALKETMNDDFVKVSDGREFAASYVAWTLGKPTLLELEDNKVISKKCYSYHLPNNAPFVNLKANEIFI